MVVETILTNMAFVAINLSSSIKCPLTLFQIIYHIYSTDEIHIVERWRMSSFTLKEHDVLSFTKFNRKFFALCVWNLREFNFIAMAHTTLKLTKVAYLNSLRECSCARMQCHKERMFFRSFCRFSHYFARAINIEWQKKMKTEKKLPHWYGIRNTRIWLHDWTINCQQFTFTDFYIVDGLGAVYCNVNENPCTRQARERITTTMFSLDFFYFFCESHMEHSMENPIYLVKATEKKIGKSIRRCETW